MKRFLWINIKFENLVRAVIAICTFIAIVIICVAFYFVFNSNKTESANFSLEDFSNITSFDVTYEVTVYSNKNINQYNICENANFLENLYNIKVKGGLEISNQNGNVVIKNENTNYIYEYNLNENRLNVISFSYIIKNINSNYSQRETDKDYIYLVSIDNNLYKYYEIFVSKQDKKIEKICLYNVDAILQILIDNINFEVKK